MSGRTSFVAEPAAYALLSTATWLVTIVRSWSSRVEPLLCSLTGSTMWK